MIFVINNLKYNTDKMELVSTKCKYSYHSELLGVPMHYLAKNVQIFKSLKNHWLLAYKTDYENCAKALSEEEAKKFLMQYDLESYEKYFGELEEA